MKPEQEFRKKVLQLHYDISKGSLIDPVDRTAVAGALGIENYNDNRLIDTIQYLNAKRFLNSFSNMADLMTAQGIDEVENGFPHFPQIINPDNSSLENKTDEELIEIVRRNENAHVSTSQCSRAKIELELRHRNKIEKSLEKPHTIGILNQGEHNHFIGNIFENIDVGINDQGKNTIAKGNKFLDTQNKEDSFWKKPETIIVLIIATVSIPWWPVWWLWIQAHI